MAVIAKFFVFMSFAAIYVYSAELFPTVVRYAFIDNIVAQSQVSKYHNIPATLLDPVVDP